MSARRRWAPGRNGQASAIDRVLRDRARTAAVLLLAVTLIASVGVGRGGSAQLQATLDDSWRGLYDLLVTAPGTSASVSGLLTPTALTSLPERMSLDDVARVRGVAGVDVAAPIGAATLGTEGVSRMYFAVPLDTANTTTANPVAYRATMTYSTDDGLGERIVDRRTLSMIIDDANLPESTILPVSDFPEGSTCFVNDVEIPLAEAPMCRTAYRSAVQISTGADSWSGSTEVIDGYVVFGLGDEPRTNPVVTLVDPAAEQALLGQGGAFLDPLVSSAGVETVDDLGGWAAEAPASLWTAAVGDLADRLATEREEALADPAYQEYLQQLADAGESEPRSLAVPFVVASNRETALRLTLDVESGFGEVTAAVDRGPIGGWDLPAGMETAAGTPVGSATYDASELLAPLSASPYYVTWPGAAELDAPLTGRATLQSIFGSATTGDLPVTALPGTDGTATVRLEATRYLDGVDVRSYDSPVLLSPANDGTVLGREAMYRALEGSSLLPTSNGSVHPSAVVVGGFDTATVAPDDSSLGYVPIGGVDPVSSTLVTGPDGSAIDPVDLAPSVSGLGIADATTTAIADIARASMWGMDEPVSAIRVRVAAPARYTPESRAEIERVAREISELGYEVTLAAGSSRQDVRVEVGGYAFGTTDPAGTQEVGTLGAVDQRWPRLGAAVTVESAVTGATSAVLWLAVLSSALLLGAVQLAGVPGRRRDATVLRTLGWRRRDIVGWFGAEELVGLVVLLAAAAVALALAATEQLGSSGDGARTAIAAGVAAIVVTSSGGVLGGARARRVRTASTGPGRVSSEGQPSGRGRLATRSAIGFGVSGTRRNVGLALTLATATAVTGWAAAALVVVVRDGVDAAGQTDLGLFASAQGLIAQVLLGLVALAGGLMLVALAQRTDRALRATQSETLRGLGWTRRDLVRARVAELVTVQVPVLLLVASATWVAAASADLAAPHALAGAAAACGAALTTVLLLGAVRKVDA